MTWREYAMYSYGVMKRKFEQWEHTRLLAATIINTVSKKKVKPTDIIKLPTDNRAIHIDAEEAKERFRDAKLQAKILNIKMKLQDGRDSRNRSQNSR